MKKKLHYLPFLISILSIFVLATYLRYSLYLDANKFSAEFQAQNAVELSSADIYKISTKLNRLYSVGNWSCLVGKLNEREFFAIKNTLCENSLITQQINISSKESGLKLQMTLSLSEEKRKIFIMMLFFQLCIILSVRFIVQLVESKKKEELRAFNIKAMRFSHDIRSPISAIYSLIESNEVGVDSKNKAIILNALDVIKNSSLELLMSGDKSHVATVVNIPDSIREVVEIKKVEYPLSNIKLIGLLNARSIIIETHFKRIISNLINNSIEACDKNKCEIIISIFNNDKNVIIEISDNGKGIPQHVQEKLGTKIFTTKTKGNGIGLASAHEDLSSWGGKLEIKSSSKDGTVISLMIPSIEECNKVILIDDDELTRMIWNNKAQKQGIDLTCYKSVDGFMNEIESINIETTIYIDNHIGELSGVELAEKLNKLGFKKLYMATGSNPNDFVEFKFLKGVIGKEPPF